LLVGDLFANGTAVQLSGLVVTRVIDVLCRVWIGHSR
jgi:hypothetical protein